MLRIVPVIDRLNDRIGRSVSWLALLIVLLGACNAVARFLDKWAGTSLSSNTWLELQWYMFAALFLFLAGQTLRQDSHVRVDLLYARCSPRGKAWIDLLGALFLLIPFCLFILWSVWPTVVESWAIREMSPDPGGLPRWPIRAAVPVGIALLLLQGIAMAGRNAAVLLGRMPADATLARPADEEARV